MENVLFNDLLQSLKEATISTSTRCAQLMRNCSAYWMS